MNDRELLEMAAKAIGLTLRYNYLDGRDANQPWNPLDDNCDALRLAVSLRMHVNVYPTRTKVTADGVYFEQLHNVDAMNATRRAIVRAAAEIGKSMQ